MCITILSNHKLPSRQYGPDVLQLPGLLQEAWALPAFEYPGSHEKLALVPIG